MESKNDRLFYAGVLVIAAVITFGVIHWLKTGFPNILLWFQFFIAMMVFILRTFEQFGWTGITIVAGFLFSAGTGYYLSFLISWTPSTWLVWLVGSILGFSTMFIRLRKGDPSRETTWIGFWILFGVVFGYLIPTTRLAEAFLFSLAVSALLVHSYLWFLGRYLQSRGLLKP
jgi:hypothetical protein